METTRRVELLETKEVLGRVWGRETGEGRQGGREEQRRDGGMTVRGV